MSRRPVLSVLVFRALDLGDMLCAVPAFRALKHACPAASITLCGLPWAREFAARYWHLFDDFIEFPGYPGLPEQQFQADRFAEFLASVRAREFDVAVQMHGDGGITNGLVEQFGALAVLRPPQLATQDGTHEIERCLLPLEAAGISRCGTHLELPTTVEERAEASRLLAQYGIDCGRPYAVVHPGAKWESRRWPAEKFGAVARQLAAEGLQVAITGVEAERGIAGEVRRVAGVRIHDLCGATRAGAVFAVIARASVVITNDTGASHVAAAVGTPSVVIASGSEIERWRPLDAERHVVLGLDAPCRPCRLQVCPHGHACVAIGPESVARLGLELTRRGRADLGQER